MGDPVIRRIDQEPPMKPMKIVAGALALTFAAAAAPLFTATPAFAAPEAAAAPAAPKLHPTRSP
jgi:hypothetical protein